MGLKITSLLVKNVCFGVKKGIGEILALGSCESMLLKNCGAIVIFQFIGNLEQSGSRIPDAFQTCIFINSKLFLTKTENRSKKIQLSHCCFE